MAVINIDPTKAAAIIKNLNDPDPTVAETDGYGPDAKEPGIIERLGGHNDPKDGHYTKNYGDYGGDKWVVNGDIDVKGDIETYNKFALTYDTVDSDAETTRAANTAKITDVTVDEKAATITITLDTAVEDLNDFDARGEWGVHKCLGIGLSAGITPITGMNYNGSPLTSEDVTEASNVGLSDGYFVRWVAADLVLAGDNTKKSKDKFTLSADGYTDKTYKLVIVEPVTD